MWWTVVLLHDFPKIRGLGCCKGIIYVPLWRKNCQKNQNGGGGEREESVSLAILLPRPSNSPFPASRNQHRNSTFICRSFLGGGKRRFVFELEKGSFGAERSGGGGKGDSTSFPTVGPLGHTWVSHQSKSHIFKIKRMLIKYEPSSCKQFDDRKYLLQCRTFVLFAMFFPCGVKGKVRCEKSYFKAK